MAQEDDQAPMETKTEVHKKRDQQAAKAAGAAHEALMSQQRDPKRRAGEKAVTQDECS